MTELRFGLWAPWSVRVSFDFFTDIRNLDRVTPPWFRLRPLSNEPLPLELGSTIEYAMRWRLWSGTWQSEIRDWQPPFTIAYEQVRGPFRYYRHEHRFHAERGGTRLQERLSFRAPGGPMVSRLLVEPELRRIFRFRESIVGNLDLRGPAAPRHQPEDL